jgi:energy-coupling factor transporter ATP-binding protein EcfA2
MEKSPGNTVLVAGRTGSGKTTLQNCLVRYMTTVEKTFAVEPVLADKAIDPLDIVDEWAAQWDEGKLKPETAAGQPKDHIYRLRPGKQHKDKPTIDIGFVEISGAVLEALAAAEGKQTALPAELSVLGNGAANAVLALVCDGSEPDDAATTQDAVLAAFIARLKAKFGDDVSSRCPVLIVATRLAEAEEDMDLSSFASERLPDTLAALEDWRAGYALAELDAGVIKAGPDGEPLLPSPKFDDAAKIFRWVYFQFTRYPVVDQPFLSRLWKSVRKSVG